MICLCYWYLFPIAIIIAILAMSSGISGTNFWIPVYLIWLNLDTRLGFWLALLTMVFGFGSGIIRNLRQGTINWWMARQYLVYAIPASIIGTLLVPYAPVKAMLILFSSFIMIYGLYMVRRFEMTRKGILPRPLEHESIFRGRAILAGFLKGLIATGLGKLIMPGIMHHKRVNSAAEAVGTTTFIIFVVNIMAVVFRLNPEFTSTLSIYGSQILQIMIFVAPGVFIGGQIGPMVAARMPKDLMKAYVGALLVFVSLLMYLRVFALF